VLEGGEWAWTIGVSVVSGGSFGFAAAAIYRVAYNRGYQARRDEEIQHRLERLESARRPDPQPGQ
jgi:hypothetical protein